MESRTAVRPQLQSLLIQLDQEPSEAALGLLLGVEAEAARHQGRWWIRFSDPDTVSPALLGALGGRRWIPETGSDPADGSALSASDAAGSAAAASPDRGVPRLALRRPGSSVPTASVQAVLPWQPVAEHFAIRLPTAAVAAAQPSLDRPRLRLVRGGPQRLPAALKVTLCGLRAWVGEAPRVRLQGLRWLWRGEHALVLGHPLPPLAGRTFVAVDRLLIPAGFRWLPPVSAATVLATCRGAAAQDDGIAAVQAAGSAPEPDNQWLTDNPWLIWESNDRWSCVDDSAWAALTRAGVRAVQEER